MADPAETVGLRRGVLAVSVLDDIVLVPDAGGVRLEVDPANTIGWAELAEAVGPADPESDVGRYRLRDWLRIREIFAALGPMAAFRSEQAAVPLGLPLDHVLHPGASWVRERVLGDVLDLGIGIRGLVGDDPDHISVLPDGLATAVGLDTSRWWPALHARLQDMGGLTVARLRRDGTGVIAPMGGCDAVTLMGARTLRTYLATSDGTGMRAIAVPMRTRGWYDLARIDPAFVSAAAAATDDVDRGFWRPLLVTCDEVEPGPAGGDVRTIVLRDPAASEPAWPAS